MQKERGQSKKTKQIKPALAGGFRDALPEDMIPKQRMIDTIRSVFERFGFDPMETPGIERTEVLVGGEKQSKKLIFNVKGSEESASRRTDLSLRFDLTVPLARVLAANPSITKPFKRYQIGKVWRGERQQAGRFREFLQMDIDILGVESMDADAEIVQVMYETLQKLGVENFKIKMNNKKEIIDLLRNFGVSPSKIPKTLIAVDKKDKLSSSAWEKEVGAASGLSGANLKKYLWTISGENNLESTAIAEFRRRLERLGVPQKYLIYDASLVRGLEYYTGSIFETLLTDLPSIGSVFSGGRFDGLTARFSNERWPAVGASIGVDRLFAALENLRKIKKQKTLVTVLVMNLSKDLEEDYARFLRELRDAGMNATLYFGDDRTFQAQLSYAVKKEIPYVLIYGDNEKKKEMVSIKNLATREQKEVPKESITEYFN